MTFLYCDECKFVTPHLLLPMATMEIDGNMCAHCGNMTLNTVSGKSKTVHAYIELLNDAENIRKLKEGGR